MKKVILILVVFLCFSCNEDETSQVQAEKGELVGSWQWIESVGSIAGVTINPENSGKIMIINFSNDNVFRKFINGNEVYLSPFIISDEEEKTNIQYTTLALFETQGLGFDHQIHQEIKFTSENTLQMIDPCCDNFVFTFTRIFS